jgi:hypothetical protein
VRNVEETVGQARTALGLDDSDDAPTKDNAATPKGARRALRAGPVIASGSETDPPATDTPLLDGARLPMITETPSMPVPPAPPIDPNDDEAIYSSADQDVVAPKIPGELLASLRTAGVPGMTNTLEMLVSERGTVERVRLLSTSKQLPDMMVLGTAKMWQLDPATREGRPVAYRLVLSWAATR